jgi:hypothetical protein
MGKRAITPELFNDLVRAFRLQPGIYGAAARATGCAHKTAKRGWLKGWESKGFPPVKDILSDEKTAVRAMAALDESEESLAQRAKILGEFKEEIHGHLELEASKAYGMQVKMEELQLLGLARKTVTSNLQSMLSLTEAGELMASRLAASIKEFAMDDSNPLVFGSADYNKAHRAFRGVAMAARDITTAVKTTLEAERLHMGEPTTIVGHKEMDDMSIEELMSEIEKADGAIAKGKARGIVAIDGGAKPTKH